MAATKFTDAELAEMRRRVRSTPIHSDRDKMLKASMKRWVRNRDDCDIGFATKRRGLFIIGETNSGKTFSIRAQIPLFSQFDPVVNHFGEPVQRLLVIECPSKSDERTLPLIVLEALGFDADETMKPKRLVALMNAQLKARGVRFIWFDEAQHLLKADTEIARQSIQNTLKSFLQEDHKVHVIFSGVPSVLNLREGDGQMVSRSEVVPFRPLADSDSKAVFKWLEEIAALCGLTVGPTLKGDEFLCRLIKSARGAVGTIIETIQESCFTARERSSAMLTVDHFAKNYARTSGCRRNENVFTSSEWRSLIPANAMSDFAEAAKPPRKSRKG
jgi:hypothetical protein